MWERGREGGCFKMIFGGERGEGRGERERVIVREVIYYHDG